MPVSPTRFIILSGPRTGSTLLQSALNSSPHVTCFGEVFNQHLEFLDYQVEGYDGTEAAFALRADDPARFLRERIFGEQPPPVGAVGFKFHYDHFWGFPGLTEALQNDADLRVIHLQRRNHLRALVSAKIAEASGVYFEAAGTRRGLASALARPLGRLLGRSKPAKPTTTVIPEELRQFMVERDLTAEHWEKLFDDHEILRMEFEQVLADPHAEFARAQRFVGVPVVRLDAQTIRQNPEPLEELVANYAELRSALEGTEAEGLLE